MRFVQAIPGLMSAAYSVSKRLTILAIFLYILSACDNFTPTPVEFGVDDVVTVGDIRTIEIAGTVLSSLPQEAPATAAGKAELGRLLFWDPVLSGNQDVACATCHLPSHGYGDGRARSIGVGGSGRGEDRIQGQVLPVPRNAQTLLNVAWNGINEMGMFDQQQAPMFWDNRVDSLAAQAIDPIKSEREMRGSTFSDEQIIPELLVRLNAIPEYSRLFSEAYATQAITETQLADSLAAFQTTLIANNSPFDRWMRGESEAMTQDQISGMQEFVIAGCAECHSGPMFSDYELHVLGVQEATGLEEPDQGDGQFGFRTPTLRQLDFTAPYFHGGQFRSLNEVIEFYDEPGDSSNRSVARSQLDPDFLALPETDGELGRLLQEFMSALNDPVFDQSIPPEVPSGLAPGG